MVKYLEDFEIGEVSKSDGRTFTESDLTAFSNLSWDTNPAHTDEEFCKKNSPFGQRIAQGALGFAIATGLSGRIGDFHGSAIAFLGVENLRFMSPLMIGDTVHLVGEILDTRATSTPGRGIVKRKTTLVNQRGQIVQEGIYNVMVYTRP